MTVHCPVCGAEDYACRTPYGPGLQIIYPKKIIETAPARQRGWVEEVDPMAVTTFTLTERTFLNADKTRVVPANSPEARYILGGEGVIIEIAEAVALGLCDRDGQPVLDENTVERKAEAAEDEAAEDKPVGRIMEPENRRGGPRREVVEDKSIHGPKN